MKVSASFLSSRDLVKDLIGDLGINYFVRDHIARAYSNKIHIIWLDLLEADEEALLKFIGTEGVENNPESAYTNIVGEVRWSSCRRIPRRGWA